MTEEAPLPSERRARLIARVRETGSARESDLYASSHRRRP